MLYRRPHSIPLFHFSLMLRFTEDAFDSEQAITIGVDFKTKVINLDGVNVKLGKYHVSARTSCEYNKD